ncbi:MAG: LapA family protein [Alphaproteobacteria bacterium]|jgi:uncharacterized integral membrane protein|nr:LapA family protein [Alphaproteobacteria bacterium]MCV6599180.1 LapA family protein [Alphaproteobacteria bacterium]
MRIISSIFSLILIFIIAIFAISNRTVVDVSMFPLESAYKMPLYMVVLISTLFGFLWGIMIMSWGLLKATIKHKQLSFKIKRSID